MFPPRARSGFDCGVLRFRGCVLQIFDRREVVMANQIAAEAFGCRARRLERTSRSHQWDGSWISRGKHVVHLVTGGGNVG